MFKMFHLQCFLESISFLLRWYCVLDKELLAAYFIKSRHRPYAVPKVVVNMQIAKTSTEKSFFLVARPTSASPPSLFQKFINMSPSLIGINQHRIIKFSIESNEYIHRRFLHKSEKGRSKKYGIIWEFFPNVGPLFWEPLINFDWFEGDLRAIFSIKRY